MYGLQQFNNNGQLVGNGNIIGAIASPLNPNAGGTNTSQTQIAQQQQTQQTQQMQMMQMQLMSQMSQMQASSQSAQSVATNTATTTAMMYGLSGALGTQTFGKIERASY